MRPLYRKTRGTIARVHDERIAALERRHYDLMGHFEFKVYPDIEHPVSILDPTLAPAQVGDNQFHVLIPDDLRDFALDRAEASIGAAASGNVVVMIRNGGPSGTGTLDMLTDPIQIDAGDCSSYFSGAPSVVDDPNAEVDEGDLLWVCVLDDGGGDAYGLTIALRFA